MKFLMGLTESLFFFAGSRLSLGYDLFIYLLLASPSFDSEGPEYYRQCQCCPVFFMLERIAAGFVCIDIIRYFLDNIE